MKDMPRSSHAFLRGTSADDAFDSRDWTSSSSSSSCGVEMKRVEAACSLGATYSRGVVMVITWSFESCTIATSLPEIATECVASESVKQCVAKDLSQV